MNEPLPASTPALLEVSDISVRFGGIVALDGVSFDVRAGQIVGLIGPNGAGKTTLFNCLSRLYDCDTGHIRFDGRSLLEMPRHRLARLGIGRTFQNVALFTSMTVVDNVMTGCHSRTSRGFLSAALRWPGVTAEERVIAQRAREWVQFVGLCRHAGEPVSQLPLPLQKRVELARALAGEPRLLLLDEPAGGLRQEDVSALARLIVDIRQRLRTTILLVEHHMGLVMSISDRIVALNFGRKIAEGTPAQMRVHADVVRAYLGAKA